MQIVQQKRVVKNWDEDSPIKQELREIMFKAIRDKNLRNIVAFPSDRQIDVRLGMKKGKIKPKETSCTFIEKITTIIQKLNDFCKEFGFDKAKTIQRDLSSSKPIRISNGKKFDWVYLDICGQYNENYGDFLQLNAPEFSETRFAQTYYLGPLSQKYYAEIDKTTLEGRTDLGEILHRNIAKEDRELYIERARKLIHLTMDKLGISQKKRAIDYACIYDDAGQSNSSVMLFFMINFRKTECAKLFDTNRTNSSILEEIATLQEWYKNEPSIGIKAGHKRRMNKIRSWL